MIWPPSLCAYNFAIAMARTALTINGREQVADVDPECGSAGYSQDGRGEGRARAAPGEPSSRPTAAAIANAVFDATGARLRTVPFTAERVKAALSGRSS